MNTQDDIYYQALMSRDARFDGKFFVGVKTTGIYCRPICPAKPKRENVEFFPHLLAAEKAGYRPCLRCRPESAPQSPVWIGKTAVVQRAIKALHHWETLEFNEDQFSEKFGVSARHLRRLFMDEVGKTPKQLASEIRLNLARKLLTETSLSITEIAFASGFQSIRRFNDAFLERFKKNPTAIRRQKKVPQHFIRVSLPYRPPYDFEGLLHFYRIHPVGNLETFEPGKMHRTIFIGKSSGKITISNDPTQSRLWLEIDFPDTTHLHTIISRVRAMFDLDSDPILIANHLEQDPKLKKILKKFPGTRLPSGWDPFEIAISTILGQLVSIDRAKTLVSDLMKIAGMEGQFPTPEQLAVADLTELKTTGIRKQTLNAFAQAVNEKKISLEPTQDGTAFIESLLKIRGIGPWSAHYMAMKILRDTDAFPRTDLILARALEIHPPQSIELMSPWRAYVAVLFWREYASTLTKTKKPRKKKP